jgi:NADH-quinone oxidoreductase subunit C
MFRPKHDFLMTALDLAKQLQARFGDSLPERTEFRGEISLEVADAEAIAEICGFAKRQLGFDYLVDISSVDNYGADSRWTIVYHLYGIVSKQHLRLSTNVSEAKSELPTVTGVWRTADWHEREIYDMMGIRFRGHGDLRRIIMWEGYPYFPLRKDFPLGGKPTEVPEVAFSETAPIEGGPFVTAPGAKDSIEREPRAKTFEN